MRFPIAGLVLGLLMRSAWAFAAPTSAAEDAGGRPQFDGIPYPPKTAGAFDVDAFFRAMLMTTGPVKDMRTFCEVRKETILVAGERLAELLGDPAAEKRMTPSDFFQARYVWASVESSQGRMDLAIRHWEDAYRVASKHLPGSVPMMQEVLGTAHLHKAEMDNGIFQRPGDRCLFPPPAGRRQRPLVKPQDALKAIDYFTKYLEAKPDDLAVRWLLNLSYRLMGRYPTDVPRRHLIPPSAFASKQDIGRFVDVAPAAGIGAKAFEAGGVVVDDFENRGQFDIVTAGYEPCDRLHYYRNNGDGTFTDRSVASGLGKVYGGLHIVQADFDNDGCMDILVPRGAWLTPMPIALLKNGCNGTFTDVTAKAGLTDRMFATQAVVWADIDSDGWLDLFVGDEQGPSQLYRSRRDGTFENVSRAAGVDRVAFTKGVTAADYDQDGDPDIYVSNIRGDNWLYRNNGDRTFTEVGQKAGVGRSFASFATWFFDYDNDTWPDILVNSAYASVDQALRSHLGLPRAAKPMKLYRNAGDGTFRDVTAAVSLDKTFMPMGANFGDVDSDGWLDVYIGTGAPDYSSVEPKVLLRNDGGRGFVDISESAGIGDIHKGHGTAFVDFEHRGRQDIVTSMGGAVPSDAHALRLFRNPGNENDWISVRLVGTKSNRAGIGARLTLTVENQGRGRRTISRIVGSGGSFGSSPIEQQIGLGKGARIVSLEVLWPVGRARQELRDVPVNQAVEVKEGGTGWARLTRKTYRLGAARAKAPAGAPAKAGPPGASR
jgi:hypothetical protein